MQEAVLAPEAAGRDLLVSAQTGSGKTVAYGLAMAATLLEEDVLPSADAPLALIIAPTRELALQVETELTWLYANTGARITACVGGMDPVRERRQLERGVHIVVGTPGRLRDHIERGALQRDALKVVVIDEADEMLDLGFHDDLEFLLKGTPEERRTFLFSATLPKPIVKLAQNYQRDALRIAMVSENGGHADIEYRAVKVPHAKVDRAVTNLLRFIDPPCAIVFCATRMGVTRLGETLASRGFAAVSLSGEMGQSERNRALQALRDGRARVCVATDVAARGLDVPNLTLVIHADLPNDAEVLQHRSGRTGRAGKKGTSILLVPPSRRRSAEEMLHRAQVQYTWTNPPTPQEIYESDSERLLKIPQFSEPATAEDAEIAAAIQAFYSPAEVATALTKLYRQQLPEPIDLDEYVEDPRARARREADGDDGPRKRAPYEKGARDKGPRDRGPRENSRDKYTPGASREPYQKRARKPETGHSLTEGAVWFRISVGRERNADPKWLLPEICRQGEVTKKEIGEIRVFDTETRFQLDASVAGEFTAKVAAREKGGVSIYPADSGEPDQSSVPEAAPRPRMDTPRRKPESSGYARRVSGKHAATGADEGAAPPKRNKKPYVAKTAAVAAPDAAPKAALTPEDLERRERRKERKKAKRKLAAMTKSELPPDTAV
ncbi:MAG: DEAD/DEAH box helicase [Rhizomicrobium sp.]